VNNYIRYYDDRFGDIYELYVDHAGNFISACRSVEAFGRDPIYYNDLDEIPVAHRGPIERLIADRLKQKDGQ
jgi:hypothetical protein